MEDNNSLKDYYKILQVDYDANEEMIKLNYRKLALKWHPDKHNGDTVATSKFQEITEAYYNVLMDPALRFEYDFNRYLRDSQIYFADKPILIMLTQEYLARFKGMILTCNGLGITYSSSPWTQQLAECNNTTDEQGFDLVYSVFR
ncbi:unnamed protein product [Arabis nemorensis]|uniref:J domain-containing protein n=1 Tax=Arabis nemorensis TaxID=586526 RepID=A0A565B3L4_9BRAS|nr:unnamed protein product [Arabis nemorensis]